MAQLFFRWLQADTGKTVQDLIEAAADQGATEVVVHRDDAGKAQAPLGVLVSTRPYGGPLRGTLWVPAPAPLAGGE